MLQVMRRLAESHGEGVALNYCNETLAWRFHDWFAS